MADPRAPFPFLFAILVFFILPLIFSQNGGHVRFAEAGKRRVHITDNLDDVVDDEEDETWKEWGKKPTKDFDLPPNDLSKLDLSAIQAKMMEQHSGPALAFIKLRLGVKRRNRNSVGDSVTEIAKRWTKVLRTGAVGVRFTGIDLSTIMVNMDSGQHITELKDFVLEQPEAYEFKIGDKAYRRPGDPPLEVVIQKLQDEKKKKETESNEQVKEEL